VNPLVFLGLWLLVCVGGFAVGLRFYRMTEPLSEQVTAAQTKRFGRLMMMSSVAMVLFAGAAWLHGDLKNIRTDWGI
jgi:fumarate reductase subunit D